MTGLKRFTLAGGAATKIVLPADAELITAFDPICLNALSGERELAKFEHDV